MKKSWSIVSLVFCLLSCAATPPKPATVAPIGASAKVREEFALLQKQATDKNSKPAIASLKKFIAAHPNTDITPKARLLLGRLYADNQQYGPALAQFTSAEESTAAEPEVKREALTQAAITAAKLKKTAEAKAFIKKALEGPLDEQQTIELTEAKLEVAVTERDSVAALESATFLAEKHPTEARRQGFKQQAQDILESRLSEDELKAVADRTQFGIYAVNAQYRYGLLQADRREYSSAASYLGLVAKNSLDSSLAEKAMQLIAQIDARSKTDVRTVGVVLPLSGKQSAIGYRALKGIQLGLGIYGKVTSNFNLAVIDSEGNPDTARKAIERLVVEDNVIAIIGGMLNKTATAEATRAQEFGVPFIGLTQRAGLTQTGSFIFQNALTSQQQIRKLLDVAMGEMNLTKFAILFPNDAYGVEITNLFWDEVKSRGGLIQAAQSYDPKETDFKSVAQKLGGTYYLEDRYEESRIKMKAWQEKNPRRTARTQVPSAEELLGPVVDFEAIFIPDSVNALGQASSMLAYNDIDHLPLIGTNLWNRAELVKKGQRYVENSLFVDGLLSQDPMFLNSDFNQQFKAVFAEDPGSFEVQAYDSALVLRQSIASGGTTRTSLAEKLLRLQNFPASTGALYMSPDREILRPVFALTVRGGNIVPFEGKRKQ